MATTTPTLDDARCISRDAMLELLDISRATLDKLRARPRHENPFPPPMVFALKGRRPKQRWSLRRVVEWRQEEEKRAVREARRTVLP